MCLRVFDLPMQASALNLGLGIKVSLSGSTFTRTLSFIIYLDSYGKTKPWSNTKRGKYPKVWTLAKWDVKVHTQLRRHFWQAKSRLCIQGGRRTSSRLIGRNLSLRKGGRGKKMERQKVRQRKCQVFQEFLCFVGALLFKNVSKTSDDVNLKNTCPLS